MLRPGPSDAQPEPMPPGLTSKSMPKKRVQFDEEVGKVEKKNLGSLTKFSK